jgi:hypothetical protein
LGRKFKLWGNDEEEVVHCEQLLCEIYDLRNLMVGFAYGRAGPTDKVGASALVANAKSGILGKLELWLAQQPKFSGAAPFLVHGHATAPDFHLFEMLDQYTALASYHHLDPLLTSLPHLRTFYDGFKNLEQNRRYFASPLYTGTPFNNVTAVFGSLVSGGQWKEGDVIENVNGVF